MENSTSKRLENDKKKGYIDLYIGNIPLYFSYDDLVNMIHTTYFYYERENRDIDALPKLKNVDILRIANLRASNPKFNQDIDFLDEQKKKEQDKDKPDTLEDTLDQTSLDDTKTEAIPDKFHRDQDDPQANMLFTFIKCRNLKIANAIRYCTNGLRIDEKHKIQSGISNRHHHNEAIERDEDAFYCDENLVGEDNLE